MSDGNNRTLLTIGVFFVTIVVAVLLYIAQLITDWTLIFPVVFLLNGIWFLALGAMRMGSSGKYERSPFSTAALGFIAIAVGGAWLVFSYGWLYSLVVILLAVAGLAIAAALKRK
jgi:hypothetical protein